VRRIFPGTDGPVRDATLAEMFRDQLPPHPCVQFLRTGPLPGFGFGLAGAVTRRASEFEPNTPTGEMQWGGLAGTHCAISPNTGHALVLMTHRYFGMWNPFWFEWRGAVYAALNGSRVAA